MAQGEVVLAFDVAHPLASVDAILEGDVHGVFEVELREGEGDGVVEIGKGEMTGLRQGLVGDLNAVEHGMGVDGNVAHEEVGEHELVGRRHVGLHVARAEGGDAVVMGEEDSIAIGVHAHAVKIFLVGKSAAVDVANEVLLLAVVLPDAHGRGAPDVAIV